MLCSVWEESTDRRTGAELIVSLTRSEYSRNPCPGQENFRKRLTELSHSSYIDVSGLAFSHKLGGHFY
jgi:hypothetical protein